MSQEPESGPAKSFVVEGVTIPSERAATGVRGARQSSPIYWKDIRASKAKDIQKELERENEFGLWIEYDLSNIPMEVRSLDLKEKSKTPASSEGSAFKRLGDAFPELSRDGSITNRKEGIYIPRKLQPGAWLHPLFLTERGAVISRN